VEVAPVNVEESGGTISDCLGFWYLTETNWMACGLKVPLGFTFLLPTLVSVIALLKLNAFTEFDALFSKDFAKALRFACFSPDVCCFVVEGVDPTRLEANFFLLRVLEEAALLVENRFWSKELISGAIRIYCGVFSRTHCFSE
jgi:hypothetical protein